MDTQDRRVLAPFRRRTVRMGIRATLLIALGLAVVPFLPGDPITHPAIYWALLGTTVVGVGGGRRAAVGPLAPRTCG